MTRGPRVAGGFGRLLGTLPAGSGGVRVIVELLLSLLAVTYAIAKNAELGKIMQDFRLLYATIASPTTNALEIQKQFGVRALFEARASMQVWR